MFKKADINYSFKNIPIPSKDYFIKCMLSKTENFIQRLRWKVLFFLQPDKTDNPQKNTFGFNTEKSAPPDERIDKF